MTNKDTEIPCRQGGQALLHGQSEEKEGQSLRDGPNE